MEKKFQYQIKEKEVIITRQFEASQNQVWNAFTDSKILDQWWAPKPWKCNTKEQDFSVGGRWLYNMSGPNGEIHWSYLDYTAINPQNSYTGLDGFCDENGNQNPEFPSSEWKNEFTFENGICTVTSSCKYDKEETLQAYLKMGFLEGYEMGLNNLEELLKKQ